MVLEHKLEHQLYPGLLHAVLLFSLYLTGGRPAKNDNDNLIIQKSKNSESVEKEMGFYSWLYDVVYANNFSGVISSIIIWEVTMYKENHLATVIYSSLKPLINSRSTARA